MRVAAVTAPILVSLSCLALTQERTPESTAFEIFVTSPSVVIESSRPIGIITSADASVEIVALVAADTAHPPARTRGIRLRMENNGGFDQVYLDRDQLAALKQDLAGIEAEIAELESGSSPYRVQGTANCWRPARPLRILCPGYRIGPDWSGMTLGVYGAREFDFRASGQPDWRPCSTRP